jgi:hypothetical protein
MVEKRVDHQFFHQPASEDPLYRFKESDEGKQLYGVVVQGLGEQIKIPVLQWLITAYATHRWEWSRVWRLGSSETPTPVQSIEVLDRKECELIHVQPIDNSPHKRLTSDQRLLMSYDRFIHVTEPIAPRTSVRFEFSSFLRHFECGVGLLVFPSSDTNKQSSNRRSSSDASNAPTYFGMTILTGQWCHGEVNKLLWKMKKKDDTGGVRKSTPYQLFCDGSIWVTLQIVNRELVVSVAFLSPDQQNLHTWTSRRVMDDSLLVLGVRAFPAVMVRDAYRDGPRVDTRSFSLRVDNLVKD